MAVSVNYYVKLKEWLGNVEHIERLVGEIQGVLLEIKDVAPANKTHDISAAAHNVAAAINQLGKARKTIMTKALKVFGEAVEVEEEFKRPFDIPVREFFIRQTEINPVERYEIRQRPTDESSTMVARYPGTGEWKCYSCEDSCSHVQSVQEWIHRGRPVLNNAVADKLATPDGYERPKFHNTSMPVGMPSPTAGESVSESDEKEFSRRRNLPGVEVKHSPFGRTGIDVILSKRGKEYGTKTVTGTGTKARTHYTLPKLDEVSPTAFEALVAAKKK